MSTVIISSTQDTASMNIKNSLLKKTEWINNGVFFNQPFYKSVVYSDIYLCTISDKKIVHEGLEEEIRNHLGINLKNALFISRHRSKSGKPTLTTHPIGNFGDALFGGKPKTVSPTLPYHMTQLLRIINEKKLKMDLYQKVCFEVTHHGPFMSIPTLFAEVGSSEEEWDKQLPADIIADSLIKLLDQFDEITESSKETPVLLGIGGGHYAPRFTDVALEKDVAFSHMIPSYHIDQGTITFEHFQTILSSSKPIDGVYLHRKALKKSQQTMFKQWCKDLELPVVSSNDFKDVVSKT